MEETKDWLEEIKARVERSTRGVWTQFFHEWQTQTVSLADSFPRRNICGIHHKNGINDAAFISNAHQDIPRLIAEVERLRAENELHKGFIKDQEGAFDEINHLLDVAIETAQDAEEDNERLRGLVAEAEWEDGDCPWCGIEHYDNYNGDERNHLSDCPAFSAPGVVR